MSLNGRDLMKQQQQQQLQHFNQQLQQQQQLQHQQQLSPQQQPPPEYNQSVLTMQNSVTITVTPQRSNSMDLLNFEEKRQLIASSLSLSDILHVSPAAAHVAKEVAASTVIGEFGGFFRFFFGSFKTADDTTRYRLASRVRLTTRLGNILNDCFLI